jgi:hypothetical protein
VQLIVTKLRDGANNYQVTASITFDATGTPYYNETPSANNSRVANMFTKNRVRVLFIKNFGNKKKGGVPRGYVIHSFVAGPV